MQAQEERGREVRKEEQGSVGVDAQERQEEAERVDAQGGRERREEKRKRKLRIHCMRRATCRTDT